MAKKYPYVNLERLYFSPNPPKYESDIRRERLVTLFVLILLVGLSIGIPFMVNLGKSIFEVPPVIY
jgi:hypothetical protein